MLVNVSISPAARCQYFVSKTSAAKGEFLATKLLQQNNNFMTTK
jgi:hypothetical protein